MTTREPGSERPHVAAVVEDAWNAGLGSVVSRLGWRPRVVAHVGYAGPEVVRVLARVLLAPASGDDRDLTALLRRRGFRNFVSAEAASTTVTVRVGGSVHEAVTDRSGNLDVRLPNPGLEPGWAEVGLRAEGARDEEEVPARVLVVGDDVRLGVVSDIDDTVLTTSLPRPAVAAYHTFLAREVERRAVPGMAELYAALGAGTARVPTCYVSTGAWNTAPTLRRFLHRQGLPSGPMLLTDWGPTHTGWFRSGREHKAECLRTLAADLPQVRWLLVGDDGQNDPSLYADFAAEQPEQVRAIALRELSSTQQALAHGRPGGRSPAARPGVPVVRGVDGHELAERLLPLLATD